MGKLAYFCKSFFISFSRIMFFFCKCLTCRNESSNLERSDRSPLVRSERSPLNWSTLSRSLWSTVRPSCCLCLSLPSRLARSISSCTGNHRNRKRILSKVILFHLFPTLFVLLCIANRLTLLLTNRIAVVLTAH